jgi:hypothetical protein
MRKPLFATSAAAVALSLLVALVSYAPPSLATVQRTSSHLDASFMSRRTGVLSQRVAMAPGVVVVGAATVAANLVSVSSDGSTFVFKSSAGALGQLAPGKVMLLQGYTVGVVVSASHSGSRLTVTTRPAALTDIFKTANISFSQPIDFSHVFGTLSSSSDPADRMSALHPQVALKGAANPVIPDVGLSYSDKGPGDFSYGVSVSPTLSRLNWSVTGCVGASFLSGKTCAGSSTGLSMSADLSGYIARAKLSGDFDISNGRNVRSSFSFLSTGGVAITYQILDPAKGDFKLPVLRIPMSFDIPFAVAGVPMLLKVSFALLITVALSAKSSTVRGGEQLTYGGAEAVTESGGSDSPVPSAMKVAGSFLTSKPSVTLSSAAVEVASQMKVGFGPALAGANILGYGDVIVAIGQTTGSLVAGLPCSTFYLTVSGHAYMEAQVSIWTIASKPVDLFSKKYSDRVPSADGDLTRTRRP